MKVLYIIDSLQTGGAEKSLLEISSRLKRFRPVVCIIYDKKSDLRDLFVKNGIEIIDLRITSRFWWLEGVKKFKEVIRELNPALVHATLFKSEIIARLALKNSTIPLLGSFVNDSYSAHRYSQQSFVRNLKLNFVRLIDSITARWVPYFMSISETISKTNAEALGIDANRITCIYRGRNIDSFTVAHPSPEQKPFIFLTVARLLRRKGYLELFSAARLLVDRGYNFTLRIAGEGGDYPLFKDKIDKLHIQENVEFLFNRKDVPELLATAHCFVFPSHYEGQGGALVEAMLAAKPIIASDIPVFREQITSEKNGKLVRLFDINQLAATMEWMIKNYEQGIAYGLNARSVALERFSIDRTVRLHEELYSRILAECS